MDEKFWFLKHSDLFEKLTAQQIARLEACSKSRKYPRNQMIYMPTDKSNSVMLLASGRVKIYHVTGDGKQALLAIIDPGELFGELAIFGTPQREEFAEAMEASVVVNIPREEIQRLMIEHPNVTLEVTRLMGLRRQRYERRLKSLLFRSNRERLVHLLLELAEKYGRSTSEGLRLDIKISHQDLANIIGSTRETVTVVLGELQAERLLAIKKRQIFLINLERLCESVDALLPQPIEEKGVKKGPLKRAPLGP